MAYNNSGNRGRPQDDRNKGVLFESRDKRNDKSPDYWGRYTDMNGKTFKLSAWRKRSNRTGAEYLSIVFNEDNDYERRAGERDRYDERPRQDSGGRGGFGRRDDFDRNDQGGWSRSDRRSQDDRTTGGGYERDDPRTWTRDNSRYDGRSGKPWGEERSDQRDPPAADYDRSGVRRPLDDRPASDQTVRGDFGAREERYPGRDPGRTEERSGASPRGSAVDDDEIPF